MSQLPPTIPTMSPGGDFVLENQPKSWPKVVGIISIVWGAIGLICNGCNLLQAVTGPMMQNWAKSMVPPDQQANFANQPPPSMLAIISAGLGFVWSILLIVAGSMLAARKPAARPAHIIWGLGSIVLLVIGGIAGADAIKQAQAQQAASPDPKMAQAMQSMQPVMYGFFACMMFVFAIYPLFCLVWFLVVKKDTREITEGVEEAVA